MAIFPQCSNWMIAGNWADLLAKGVDINNESIKYNMWGYTFQENLVMMSLGGFLFFIIGLYLDAVIPKEFGKSSHPCFMFLPSSYTWCCKKSNEGSLDDFEEHLNPMASPRSQKTALDSSNVSTNANDHMELDNLTADSYEAAPPEVIR